MNTVVLPPEITPITSPVIFLAGPITGAEDWQASAIDIINKLTDGIIIANPRREYLDDTFVYENQVDWETHHLKLAATKGVILFWLAAQNQQGDKDERGFYRAYAQTTRFELAEAKMKHQLQGGKLVVGFEEGFGNTRYIRRRLMQDCPDVPLLESLEDTCAAAVKLIKAN